MINELLKGSLHVLVILLYWEKRFSREHTKNPNANVRASPDVTFWAAGYHSPQVPTSFTHRLCKMCEYTYVLKY